MTNDNAGAARLRAAGTWVIDTAKVLSALLVLFGFVVSVFGPARAWWVQASEMVSGFDAVAKQVAENSEQLRQNSETLDVLSRITTRQTRQIELLSIPADIVLFDNYRALSPCSRRTGCVIEFRVRRVAGATLCRVMPERSQHIVVSDEDEEIRFVETRRGSSRNIDDRWITLEVDLREMPEGMPLGPGFYQITTFYTDCPWQKDGEPAAYQTGPQVPIIVTE